MPLQSFRTQSRQHIGADQQMKIQACLIILLCGLVTPAAAQSSKSTYPTSGLCGDLPRVDLGTPDGFCVGLVAQGFRFTRGMAPLPNGDLIVADMGGWSP